MNTAISAKRTARPYSSTLRERQTEQTRELILQALTEQLAEEGLNDFNIPAVARKAGVSVRTVYRYFPTKDALLDAVETWLDQRILGPAIPTNVDDLPDSVEAHFRMFDEHVSLILAQLASPTGQKVRARGRRKRLETFRVALRDIIGELGEDDALAALAVISRLFSASTWKSFREEFGMTGAESGKAASWAIQTLIQDLRRKSKAATGGDVYSSL